MTETRAARVEQNTRHKAEPSTLYQVYRCINNIRDIVISQQVNMFQQGTNSMFKQGTNLNLHLQLTTLYEGLRKAVT